MCSSFIKSTIAYFTIYHWNAEKATLATLQLLVELLPPPLVTEQSKTFNILNYKGWMCTGHGWSERE
jgi:hypothetical protein